MPFKPHDYQREAIRFIKAHEEAALFLDMGLGKTVSTLTAIDDLMLDDLEVGRTLVIAPLRVARNTWPSEIAKWEHLRYLKASLVLGSREQRLAALNKNAHIYVINRENVPWLVETLGSSWPFDMVVLDELSSFKAHNAQRVKALCKVRPYIKRMVGLTGTPAPNGYVDLFAQFKVLDGGKRLGRSITRYRDAFFTPDKRSGAHVYSWKLRPGADQAINRLIADMTLSMQAVDHLNLPELAYLNVDVELSATERKTYTALRDELVAQVDSEKVEAASAATLGGKLLQMSGGAVYGEDGNVLELHERKLDALAEIIEQSQGQSVLTAYWYRHELERLRKRFPNARLLSTPSDFEAWNAGTTPHGIIHPASAGHGLNLQAGGHILVWLTLPWSLELYQQANARLYRQGQKQPVSVVHILSKNTIDEDVLEALQAKDATQTRLVEAVKKELGI